MESQINKWKKEVCPVCLRFLGNHSKMDIMFCSALKNLTDKI